MKNRSMLLGVALVLAMIGLSQVRAVEGGSSQTSFNCEIITAMDAGDDGKPIPTQLGGNAKFVVDRLSGRIIGSILDNGNFDFEINGDGRNIVITKTHVAYEFLRIMTYKNSRKKPFVAVDYLGRVYIGLCS